MSMSRSAAPGPLTGVQVLDLSPFLPGPFCTQMLADLGASVIKVESPRGDPARTLPGDLHDVANRGKRSVVLDLKAPDGQALGRQLAGESDVLVEGFRPGVADRLGMSYSAVQAVNPGIVYCSVSGFGQTGPLRDSPGHDITYLAASGVLPLPGEWGAREPRRPGVPLSDLAASSYAAVAILAALYRRKETGEGVHLDLAITDAALAFATVRADCCLAASVLDEHLHPTNELFKTADGATIALGAIEEHFWQRLAALLAPEFPTIAEPRFATATDRRTHGDELSALLRKAIRTRSAPQWLAAFEEADVPAHRVLSVPEAARSPHAQARGIVAENPLGHHVTFPVLYNGAPLGRSSGPAPALGADTEHVLAGDQVQRDPVPVAGHRAFGALFAPVNRAAPGYLTAARGLGDRPVHGQVIEVESDHLVVAGQGLAQRFSTDAGPGPVVKAAADGAVRAAR
ncbi:crotonobetainyl-CoA:carnitine CoA-transferase CaiB-like acyl-CoA transferase [Pseudonocardia parietis]|uniref:Crotonobetainyl-CoA:carnitine CoA-transferase CaiB-like acyl-CoA transferase n=1 Tax=Pseudonocardia parietis TaxID=570936 RepID=A0ABS4VMN8_9PSEU|nr:crotonobetainyl-CoA:carnitine CoA-transferase CaiB-like acyl-CoA transferase [Pseudonocardia parietis]